MNIPTLKTSRLDRMNFLGNPLIFCQNKYFSVQIEDKIFSKNDPDALLQETTILILIKVKANRVPKGKCLDLLGFYGWVIVQLQNNHQATKEYSTVQNSGFSISETRAPPVTFFSSR